MLTITDLSKTYPGDVRALDGVTLEIGKGMFVPGQMSQFTNRRWKHLRKSEQASTRSSLSPINPWWEEA